MTLRTLACTAVAACLLGLAACGDDDEPGRATTADRPATGASGPAGLAAIKDVEPRSAKPNLVRGDEPIATLAEVAAGDAVQYWTQVFRTSELPYQTPSVNVLTQPGDNGCGQSFDPSAQPVFLCASGTEGSRISLGAPVLDQIRSDSGDGAVAFLAGYAPALDAVLQVTGNEDIGEQQMQVAACFNGAWIRYLGERQILEEGDDQEVLDAASKAVPGADASIGPRLVATGFTDGVSACQRIGAGQ